MDRRTDGQMTDMTKLIVAFRNLANVLNKIIPKGALYSGTKLYETKIFSFPFKVISKIKTESQLLLSNVLQPPL
jgi:hypothetical protein